MIAAAALWLAATAGAAPVESVATKLAELGARPLPDRTGDSVVVWLPAAGSPDAATPTPPFLVLGTRVDGAQDAGPSVAAVLGAAVALSRKPAARPVVVAFWSGELPQLEEGPWAAGNVFAYVHVGANAPVRDNRLRIEGTGSSPAWPALIERTNVAAGFDVSVDDSPFGAADSMVFYLSGIASVNLTTAAGDAGGDEDPGSERLGSFAAALVRNLAALGERPLRVEIAREPPPGSARPGARAFTGTVPDYAAQVEGLRLGGVIAGGPAAAAGLREGDVIVELAGTPIANVRDYAEVLDGLEPNRAVDVVYLRDGARHRATITPGSR